MRDQVNSVSEVAESSPSMYRLRWDNEGLVFEQRSEEGSYQHLSDAGVPIPPSPVAASHPEMEAVLVKLLDQFRRTWMGSEHTLDLSIAPPWGSGWLIDAGALPEEDIEDHVCWELQQRLDSPLGEYIYAWHPLQGGEVYALVIRPELLEFWDRLVRKADCAIGAITMKTGLVNATIEQSADLLPLYRMWAGRSGTSASLIASTAVDDVFGDSNGLFETVMDESKDDVNEGIDVGEDVFGADSFVSDSYTNDEYADGDVEDELDAIFGDKGGKKKRKVLPWVIVGILAGVVIATLLPKLNDGMLLLKPIVELFKKPQGVEVVDAVPAGEQNEVESSQSESAETRNALQKTAGFGETLEVLFDVAGKKNVRLASVILQGDFLRCEIVGQIDSVNHWMNDVVQKTRNDQTHLSDPVAGAQGAVATIRFDFNPEAGMTKAQFDELAMSLGITRYGSAAYKSDQIGLERLFEVLSAEKRRPFRITVQHDAADVYLLAMLP